MKKQIGILTCERRTTLKHPYRIVKLINLVSIPLAASIHRDVYVMDNLTEDGVREILKKGTMDVEITAA